MLQVRDYYRPGKTNINKYEAQLRFETGVINLLISLALTVFLKVVDAALFWYVLLVIPFALATLGYLQSRSKFCTTYAFKGLQNAARSIDEPSGITSETARERDKDRAWKMLIEAVLVATTVTLVVIIFVA